MGTKGAPWPLSATSNERKSAITVVLALAQRAAGFPIYTVSFLSVL